MLTPLRVGAELRPVLGDGTVSVVALAVFIALVAYVTITRRDVQSPAHAPHPHPH